jgi:clan AA aspartic protease
VKHPLTSAEFDLQAWIDTGFTGELVVPLQQLALIGLHLGIAVQAVLADASSVKLDTYVCELEWFGLTRTVEIVANQGQFPLLGTGLLKGRQLQIDFLGNIVSLN